MKSLLHACKCWLGGEELASQVTELERRDSLGLFRVVCK